jgi:ribonuclease J
METRYRFWGGLDKIGGNIVEVRTEAARILTDFGPSVNREPIDPEREGELEYLMEREQMPQIPELYDTSSFERLPLASVRADSIATSLFISHIHLDHMGGLRYLPKGTKVYVSKEFYTLFYALVDVGEEVDVDCTLIPFEYEKPIQVGDIKVIPYQTDHDTIGCAAFFIETEDLKLIHSGDLRLSGYHPDFVWKWVEKAKQWQPDILCIEGTSFSFDPDEVVEEVLEDKPKKIESEEELLKRLEELLNQSSQAIVFNPYIRNVERMKKVDEIVRKSGRIMVWEENYAQVLHAFYPNESWVILEETMQQKKAPYEEEILSLEEIAHYPEKYVLQNSVAYLEFLTSLPGALYLHSNGEPLGPFMAHYDTFIEFLEKNRLDYLSFATSGHAKQEDLLEVAKAVEAKFVMPWHTYGRERFKDALEREKIGTFYPILGEEYTREALNQ